MYSITIRELEVYAYHGVPAEERVLGHRYVVDLDMTVDGAAPETDHIDDTVDYAKVAEQIQNILLTGHAHTLERLANLMCERILKMFSKVEEVTITIEKPLPPMPFIAVAAGVTLTRSRDEL